MIRFKITNFLNTKWQHPLMRIAQLHNNDSCNETYITDSGPVPVMQKLAT